MTRKGLAWIDEELDALETLGLLRRLRVRAGPADADIQVDGCRLLNFGSNDYLGMANEPALSQAVGAAVDVEGWGSGASPLITGRGTLHAELEQRLAQFEGTEAALVFSSGFAANMGTIAALVGRGDIIFSDAHNHASIIDGCRLSGARVEVYPHGDLDFLAQIFPQAMPFRRRLIVTDSLFSMQGDFAPLVGLAELADRFDSMLMVDEAHATGVFGEEGRGVCELLSVEDRVDVRVGTFSKALGCGGGFVAGSQSLINWLANRSRSYVFSTAPPGAWCAAAQAALEMVCSEPHRRLELLERSQWLREELRSRGWQIGQTQSQIIPLYIGQAGPTVRLADALLRQGLFLPAIRPPSVPEGESLLRISLSSKHSRDMCERLLQMLDEVFCEFRDDFGGSTR